MNEELLELGEKAIKKAELMGANQVEVFIESARSFSISVKNNAITSATENRDIGCGIRSIIDKKIGFGYVTNILEMDLLDVTSKSVKLAKASLPDPDFRSLPSSVAAYKEVKGLFDPMIDDLTPEEATDLIVRVIDATKSSVGDFKVATMAQITTSVNTRVICNSLGISGLEKTSSISIYSFPIVRDTNQQTSSFEYQVSRNLNTIDPEWVGRTAGENACKNFGSKTIECGELPVILAPTAVNTILGYGFAGAINAEEIIYGRSYLLDAIGEKIAAADLNITDDAIMTGGIGSRLFDAEGFPSQQTEILSSGVLKNILHNSYTANKMEVENTGNAARPSYSGIPSIAPSNLVITPGKGSQEDLIAEVQKGVLCQNTGDTPNMITGELSAMIMEGHYIEKGEIKHPVKNTLIGIDMQDLLQKVCRIGNDVRITPNIITPSIVIEKANITSG